MRVAVFGPGGMLGRRVVKELHAREHVPIPIYRTMFSPLELDDLKRTLEDCQADAIVNCAGVIPVRDTSVVNMIYINSMFPHVLVQTGLPVILVSTDCVFSGRSRYRYASYNIPDPKDYYGVSKRMGEVAAANSTVVRTSFIGCEHGIMNEILRLGKLDHPTIWRGWKNMLWTGSTVQAVAAGLIDLLLDPKIGIVHLATETVISKHDLSLLILERYNLRNVTVEECNEPYVNRALAPTHILKPIRDALWEYECLG